MSKPEKTLEKLKRKPVPSDIKWTDLCTLLQSLGYEVRSGSGSRRKFFHRERNLLISCHEPHPSPDVAKACVTDVLEHLRDNGLIT